MPPFALTVTRRTLLGLLAGASAGAIGGLPRRALAAPAIGLDGFLALSARLTGRAAGELDGDIAGRILAALQALGQDEALAALAHRAGPATGPLADRIVAAWTSGVVGTGAQAELVAYTDALLWDALDFTKPGGFCGGETGYWARPPAG